MKFVFQAVCLVLLSFLPAWGDTKTIYVVTWEDVCEHSCQGFLETIEKSGLDAEVVLRLANQDKTKFPGYVEESRALGADIVATYGTSVTLGILGKISDEGDPRFITETPGVFWYVADPFGAGIAESFDGTGRPRIAGTFNRVPEEVNIRTIRSISPSFRHLGIL